MQASGERIYFPRYSAETRSDLSSHTSLASEPDAQEITQVGTGSVYPINGCHFVAIPRLSAIPRTESMEVQGSGFEDNDDIRSDVSLVDSLDDPGSPKHNRSQSPIRIQSPVESLKDLSELTPALDDSAPPTKTSREKGESFFVPITDEYDIMDEQLVVAESMPEKLREKLQRRQMELDAKKEMEFHKQFAKINKENMNGKNKKNSIIVLSEPETISTAPPVVILQPPIVKKNGLKPKNTAAKPELGMLESYTIDSRGNMQFQNNGGRGTAAIKILPKSKNTPVVASNSTATIKKIEKNTNNEVMKVKRSDKITNDKSSKPKDSQSLTLYSNQSDLTPDVEGGPRRMYQKTEIRDNGKQIEILEIVECMDSSPDLQRSYRSRSGESTPGKKSMIPVPVSMSATTTNTSSIRILPNKPTGKRDKIDRVIADLLIGAINDPDSSVVELIQSPKDSKKATTKSKHKQIAKRGSSTNIRYSQNFDVIPEERSSMSSNDESKSQKTKKIQIIKAKNSERFIAMGNTDPPRSMTTLPSEIGSRPQKSSPTRAFDLINNNPTKSPTFIKITPTVNLIDGRPGGRLHDAPSPSVKISPWASPTYNASSSKNLFRGGRDAIEHDAEPRGWMGFYSRHEGSPFDGSPSEGTRV